MCGIIGCYVNKKKDIIKKLQNIFLEQYKRGTEGYGVLIIRNNNFYKLLRGLNGLKMFSLEHYNFWKSIRCGDYIIIHHRNPTSTGNYLKATHPFITVKGKEKNEGKRYAIIHNGIIYNDKYLYDRHVKAGHLYVSEKEKKYNDSEVILHELEENKGDINKTFKELSGWFNVACVEEGTEGIFLFTNKLKGIYIYKDKEKNVYFSSENNILDFEVEDEEGMDSNTIYKITKRKYEKVGEVEVKDTFEYNKGIGDYSYNDYKKDNSGVNELFQKSLNDGTSKQGNLTDYTSWRSQSISPRIRKRYRKMVLRQSGKDIKKLLFRNSIYHDLLIDDLKEDYCEYKAGYEELGKGIKEELLSAYVKELRVRVNTHNHYYFNGSKYLFSNKYAKVGETEKVEDKEEFNKESEEIEGYKKDNLKSGEDMNKEIEGDNRDIMRGIY